jgi:CubicO group peptidase (beta-lactamase class C family)
MPASLDATLERLRELGELGVQVAAYAGEELIVDAWTGPADPDGERAVDGDTLFGVFSVTKAVTAVALHIQAERGLIDYAAPLARYWPEFAAHGKDAVLVRHVLEHRSGVPQLPAGTTPERLGDWEWMTAGIAALEPLYAPGTKSSYQAFSFGWLVGELVRRTDGRPFGRFVQEEICGPLGIADFHIGLAPEEEPRVATLVGAYAAGTPEGLAPLRSVAMPVAPSPATFNRPDVHRACNPGAGGIANARSVARFFAMLANRGEFNGVRVLSEGTVWALTRPRENRFEFDEVTGRQPQIGRGGLWIGGPYPPADPVGGGAYVVCHPGSGGSIGWADIEARLAVAFCHTAMRSLHTPPPAWDEHPHAVVGDAVRAEAARRARA